MKSSKLALVLLLAASAAARGADEAAERRELKERAARARQSLGAVERSADRLEGRELRRALKEVRRAEKRLGGLAGEAATEAEAEAEKMAAAARRRSAETDAIGRLHLIRAALKRYNDDHDGFYPERLAELAPRYLDRLPEATLPDHPSAETVHAVQRFKGDKPDPYVNDSGGWLYFRDNDEHPLLGGQLLLDCRHKTASGREFYKY